MLIIGKTVEQEGRKEGRRERERGAEGEREGKREGGRGGSRRLPIFSSLRNVHYKHLGAHPHTQSSTPSTCVCHYIHSMQWECTMNKLF